MGTVCRVCCDDIAVQPLPEAHVVHLVRFSAQNLLSAVAVCLSVPFRHFVNRSTAGMTFLGATRASIYSRLPAGYQSRLVYSTPSAAGRGRPSFVTCLAHHMSSLRAVVTCHLSRSSSRSTDRRRDRPIEGTIDRSLWTTTRRRRGCGRGCCLRTSSETALSPLPPVM